MVFLLPDGHTRQEEAFSLAWAVVAYAVPVGVTKSSIGPNPWRSDVISDVEAESSRVPAAA